MHVCLCECVCTFLFEFVYDNFCVLVMFICFFLGYRDFLENAPKFQRKLEKYLVAFPILPIKTFMSIHDELCTGP